MTVSPRASIVIRTKNEVAAIGRTLHLLQSQSGIHECELIIVDSGSTDGTLDALKAFPNAQVLQVAPQDFTFGRSLNVGIQESTGDYVVSLSAHAFPVDDSWLQQLLAPFENPEVAGVYGRQIPHEDAWPPVRRDYAESPYDQNPRVQDDPALRAHHFFSNANSAIRRARWVVQPFDEQLSGCEDQHWARAQLKAGFVLHYAPEAVVRHSHNEALVQVKHRMYREQLALRELHGDAPVGFWSAMNLWRKALWRDLAFLVRHGGDPCWLFRLPRYRWYWSMGWLKAGQVEVASRDPEGAP